MTIPLDSKAFDTSLAHPLQLGRMARSEPRGRVLAMAVTIGLHVAVAVGLIAGVHVATLKIPPVLMVHINPPQQKQVDEAPPPPQLQKPSIVVAPPPVFQVQAAPSPILAQAPAAIAAPPPSPPVTAQQKETGEGRGSFLARLLGQLNHYKQYPRAARQAHIEGVVMLHFVMDADGKVLVAEIAKSSGRPILDAEALALIRRAQPLPPLPADFPTRSLDAVVPIEFALQG